MTGLIPDLHHYKGSFGGRVYPLWADDKAATANLRLGVLSVLSERLGRLVLNILLSFAQFEREIIGERIRDKKLATARQGKYVGGQPFLGYDIDRQRKRLIVNPAEAELVRHIFESFVQFKSPLRVAKTVNAQGHRTKEYRAMRSGKVVGGQPWNVMSVYRVLTNRKYLGEMTHKGKAYPGEHEAILDRSYIGRILRLATLAPDIVQAALAGKEPSGLSLTRLRDDLPMNWAEQRQLLSAHR